LLLNSKVAVKTLLIDQQVSRLGGCQAVVEGNEYRYLRSRSQLIRKNSTNQSLPSAAGHHLKEP